MKGGIRKILVPINWFLEICFGNYKVCALRIDICMKSTLVLEIIVLILM